MWFQLAGWLSVIGLAVGIAGLTANIAVLLRKRLNRSAREDRAHQKLADIVAGLGNVRVADIEAEEFSLHLSTGPAGERTIVINEKPLVRNKRPMPTAG